MATNLTLGGGLIILLRPVQDEKVKLLVVKKYPLIK